MNGSPALKTVRAQANGINTEIASVNYNGGAGANTYAGRIPTADTNTTPNTLYIGTDAAYFCVDNDNSFNNNCGDSYSQRRYELKIGYSVEPTGVIQQIGPQARFGLFEFKPTGDGARMLVGVGSRQSIDFSGSSVETFNTNTAAMIDAVQESFPSTWTPLSESLYETTRYVAQINSTYLAGSYVYPIAYSGGSSNGVAFQGTGAGSIGASEISVLTPPEVCPPGYISNACGRDPFFFGSNHTPSWATSSVQVSCCKTFVILVTDGAPTQDTNIPTGLQDYAHGRHGLHCTNADTSSPTAPIDTTCNAHQNTTAPFLLGEHKTDYASSGNHYLDDVAYWAHTNDLRPCNGAAD
jgi:type IV pilus assembly protein PilY1